MDKIIEVKNLNKTYKIRQNKNLFTGLFHPNYMFIEAVKNVSFEVNEGESLAFLGPNGAGKTTTTKMMTGIIYPTSGDIKVLGFKPFERDIRFLMQIGLVMGNKSSLSWDLTALQSFDFIRKIYCLSKDDYSHNLEKLIELLNVKDHLHKQIRKLSLGERMKMELIGAILHNPKVLFLDEPTIGLDITSKKNIRQFLKDIQRDSNITIVLTSHDMDDVEKICDRVVVINKGEKVYDNHLKNLEEQYNQNKYIRFYIENNLDLPPVDYATVVNVNNDSVTYELKKEFTSKLISEIIEKCNVLDIDIISVPLEEMIEDIFKNSVVT